MLRKDKLNPQSESCNSDSDSVVTLVEDSVTMDTLMQDVFQDFTETSPNEITET